MLCSVILLAAGQGKRMQSQRSKVLHTLGAKSFIGHVVHTAKHLNPDPFIVVHGHLGHQVQEALSHEKIQWAEQMPPQGTGHAVQQALPFLGKEGVSIILYGDVPLIQINTLKKMLESAQQNKLALLVLEMENPTGYGRILRDQNQRIHGIVEEKDATAEQKKIREVNTGMMAVPTAWLHEHLPKLSNDNAQKEFYLTDLIKFVSDAGHSIEALYPEYEWEVAGVNDRIQQAQLEKEYQRFQAVELMKKGVSLRDPERFDVRGSLECGKDTEIDVNCIFEGVVKLGSDVKIGAHCIIRNSVIEDHVVIEPFSHIDGAQIGKYGKIGPFARLRPDTQLKEHVHIGNFVEVKKSLINQYSKVNHLSYIGDAEIGKRVNIGAGTITCNYDGVQKYRTTVGDDVFIGSATQLVAPVTLANNVTIAAGTTVWKDVNDQNCLVLNTKQQQHRSNWERPYKKEGK